MKKILMLTTGGTIASIHSNEGLIPSSNNDFVSLLGGNTDIYSITTKDIFLLDSSNIQPEEWKILAKEIFEGISDYDGIIITHGTDTMAYTSSMMCFMIQNPSIPIVFTGSQLPISHPLTDAVGNLRCAVSMACCGVGGIFLAFDRKIILGCRAVKVRTTGFNAFESINSRIAGYIDSNGLNLRYDIIPKYTKKPQLEDHLDSNIFLLKLTPGTNPNIIDLLINTNISGIVIEAFGAGGISFIRRDFIQKIEKAVQHNIPVVVCSQCLYEKADFSIYQVGAKAIEAGVIEALDMTTEATVTKLMWALSKTKNLDELRNIFKTSYAGEINQK